MTNVLENALVNSRRQPPARRRLALRGLLAVALGLAVALPGTASATSPAPSPTAGSQAAAPAAATATQVPGTPGVASHAPAPAPALRPVNVPGLSGSSSTVTLPTGDKVTLSREKSGKYLMSAAPDSPSRLTFSVLGATAEQAHVSAYPEAAAPFVQLHLLDAQAFDVTWLAGHGDTGAKARIPLTVHYGGRNSAAALTTKAGALTGATVVRADAASGDVRLSVPAARAGAFWAALTGGAEQSAAARGTARPAFAGGVTKAWLTGHQAPSSAVPAGAAASTVTWTFTKKQGDAAWCPIFGWFLGVDSATGCPSYPILIGLTGAAAGQTVTPTGFDCLDANPCTTYAVTFTVPNGVYDAQDMSATFRLHGILQSVDTVVPQVVVAGDTTVTTDLDRAAKVTVDAPRAAVDLEHYISNSRTAPGVYSAWQQPDSSGLDTDWVTPTDPVTVGNFHLSSFWLRGQAPVSAAVSAPSRLTLHPYYARYTDLDSPRFTRFSGTTTAQVVSVGSGSAADFAKADVRGKLVLMRRVSGISVISTTQLAAALRAGAAGVLIDPRDDDPTNLPVVPVEPYWWWTGEQPVKIPFATITPDDAAALSALLAKGTATVSITDHGYSPYFYNLAFAEEGRVPATLHYSVDDGRLAQRTTSYHSPQPGSVTQSESVFHPDDFFALLVPSVFAPAPSTVQQYYGPVSPDLIWDRIGSLGNAGGGSGPDQALDVFDKPAKGTEEWFAAPDALGAPAVPDTVYGTGLPLKGLYYCAFCRQGDIFYPTTYLTSGANPALVDSPYLPYVFDPSTIHLYQNGAELPQHMAGGVALYQLSDQPATDRFTVDAGAVHSDWTFTSRRPTADGLPQAFNCVGEYFGHSGPCGADPLIQLRYNAFAGAGDTVRADARHRIEITPYTMADPATPYALTSLKVWTSTDGGGTWTEAAVSRSASGAYSADYRVPSLPTTSGAVSVKVQAADAAGDSVTQTTYDAYGLTAG